MALLFRIEDGYLRIGGTIPARQDAEAIVLDLVQPVGAERGALAGEGRQGSIMPSPR
jgi:hypothetical protein